MHYSYHNRLKQLLKTEPYIVIPERGKFSYRFVFTEIGKSMPIRSYRNQEYAQYINV